MKTIFTVTTEHDGLMAECFTNIKSLFDFLTKELNIEYGSINSYGNVKPNKYNYTNLVKEIRSNQQNNRFFVANIFDTNIGDIKINELGVVSKI